MMNGSISDNLNEIILIANERGKIFGLSRELLLILLMMKRLCDFKVEV